ncbi:MAG: glycerol dehydrogenase [Euryarchaeota archaeon]|jgi:RPA family protein|nr:glycerol dehydrogenase [Euryarchaeota archaeon]
MNIREVAWRLFSAELNGAVYEIKGEAEKSPSYAVTPLGAMVNRVLMAGVLTEKENVGTEDDPLWRGRVQDTLSGSFYINIGRFQPEAAEAIAGIDTPAYVAVVGKVRTYTTDDGRTFVSVRPETISVIDEPARDLWLLEAAESSWSRLKTMRKAISAGTADKKDLVSLGIREKDAEGVLIALDQYGTPNSMTYLKPIQNAIRTILPDHSIDLGLPEDIPDDYPDEIEIEPGSTARDNADMEDIVLRLLEELDTDGKGALREELESKAMVEGITSMELEEITNTLMDKGLVYEPNIRHLKRI